MAEYQAKESLGRNRSFCFGGKSRNVFSKIRLSLTFQQTEIVLPLQLEPDHKGMRLCMEAGFGGKEVNTFFAFSLREMVAESRMRGYFKLLNFLAFSVHKIPSPTTVVVPPLPKWARVFDWNAEFSFSIGEKVAVRSDEGIPASI